MDRAHLLRRMASKLVVKRRLPPDRQQLKPDTRSLWRSHAAQMKSRPFSQGDKAQLAHDGHFIYFAFLVVGSPFAGLFAILEVSRAQPGSIFSEPFPIAFRDSADCSPLGPDAAIVVMFDVLFLLAFFSSAHRQDQPNILSLARTGLQSRRALSARRRGGSSPAQRTRPKKTQALQ